MPVAPSALRAVPLFADITDDHLAALLAACEDRKLAQGDVLFEEDTVSDRLMILVDGEVEVSQHGAARFRLRPVAPVGELGAIAGLRRAFTAIAATPVEIVSIETEKLLHFFEQHGDVAYPFHHNLLHVVADKLERDARRIQEMRLNIIQTQKAMKLMREALLDAEDNELHRMLFEELDAHIEQNRKGHYLVDVPKAVPVRVRLDGGEMRDVVRISNEWLTFAVDGMKLAKGDPWSAVLCAPDVEIPVSGNVEASGHGVVTIDLDSLIDDYATELEALLTRLQMLDVVL